jgi:hypothetical protein
LTYRFAHFLILSLIAEDFFCYIRFMKQLLFLVMLVFSASLYAGATVPEVVTKTEISCFIPEKDISFDVEVLVLVNYQCNVSIEKKDFNLDGLKTRAGPLTLDDYLQSTNITSYDTKVTQSSFVYRRARDGLICL